MKRQPRYMYLILQSSSTTLELPLDCVFSAQRDLQMHFFPHITGSCKEKSFNNQSNVFCKPPVLTEKTAVLHQQCRADILTQPLIWKQKFLTDSLYFCLFFSSSPPFLLYLLPSRQGEAGPKGRKGEVCRIRLCGIRYNPFCLILHHSEKPCQACTASIEDLQSQYLRACGNLAPCGKNIHLKSPPFYRHTHLKYQTLTVLSTESQFVKL